MRRCARGREQERGRREPRPRLVRSRQDVEAIVMNRSRHASGQARCHRRGQDQRAGAEIVRRGGGQPAFHSRSRRGGSQPMLCPGVEHRRDGASGQQGTQGKKSPYTIHHVSRVGLPVFRRTPLAVPAIGTHFGSHGLLRAASFGIPPARGTPWRDAGVRTAAPAVPATSGKILRLRRLVLRWEDVGATARHDAGGD